MSELVGLKKYRMERSSGPRLSQNSKERLCPLGQPAIDAMIRYAKAYERHWRKKPTRRRARVTLNGIEVSFGGECESRVKVLGVEDRQSILILCQVKVAAMMH